MRVKSVYSPLTGRIQKLMFIAECFMDEKMVTMLHQTFKKSSAEIIIEDHGVEIARFGGEEDL